MTSKQVADRLGITSRHAARLAKQVNVGRRNNWEFYWENEHIKAAKDVLKSRAGGKGRFTKGQTLCGR